MHAYWRIRLKNQEGNFTREAWERDEIGIWYGAWTAEDFRNVDQHLSNQQIAENLSGLPDQEMLVTSGAWDSSIPSSYMGTARRFLEKISEGDWAVIYLEDEQAIALAQMNDIVRSDRNHPLNTRSGEIFKYRHITNKKKFAVSQLPDAFRLVPTQGRGNVHEFSRMYEHVKLLADYSTADEIVSVLGGMPFDKQLDFMGASAWESFCVSWLIMEKNFIPTGLSTGRTLKAVDIVGRNRLNGNRIIAQCKKDPYPLAVEEDFINRLSANDEGYYFAYGGCNPEPSDPKIQLIDGASARRWADTQNGKLFQRLFLGDLIP